MNNIETYEQKYKNALSKARNIVNSINVGLIGKDSFEAVFPELKESRDENADEKVRKALIKLVTNHASMDLFIEYDIHLDEALSWLEKQGVQKPYSSGTMNEKGDFDDGFTRMMEKGQKPIDNVEPKFKVGDWVTDGDKTTQIVAVGTGLYIINRKDMSEVSLSTEYIEKWYHLWTIQDAKDGDVLVTDKSVFIYAKVSYNKPYAYCGVDKFGVFKDNCLEHDWANSVNNIHPATKEQRNILFQKMKENGYEWDAEKKELKKLVDKEQIKKNLQDNSFRRMFEQKPADKVESKFHEGDWITDGYNKIRIVAIEDDVYKYSDNYILGDIKSIDERYHLWTIQDAKDGDVLVDEDNNIGIYKEIEGLYWDSYIYLGCDGKLRGFSIGSSHKQANTRPATKEQQDKLKKAMAEVGYVFDFEKKELKFTGKKMYGGFKD